MVRVRPVKVRVRVRPVKVRGGNPGEGRVSVER